MCVHHHYTFLYQNVLHELLQKVVKAMPMAKSFLRAVDGMWRRIVPNEGRSLDIYWGLATEGYQQYVAYSVFDTVGFYPYFVVYFNDNYFKTHTVKWDKQKPWRDLWYENENGFSPRNQWDEVLPIISP